MTLGAERDDRADSVPPFGIVDEADLTRLFDAALDAVVGMDAVGLVTAWNRQAEAMFGWSREEVIGRVLGDVIVPEHLRNAHADGLQRYLETGEGPVLNRRIEVEGLRRTGEVFPVELAILPLEGPATPRFFAFLRDLTDRRAAESRLKQQAFEAEVLWDAARLAATGGSVHDLLKSCLDRICQVTGWQVGHVYLPDNVFNPQRLVASDVWTVLRDDLTPMAQDQEGAAMLFGQGLPGRIWEHGSAQWIPDLAAEVFPRRELFGKYGLHAAFGFPIYAQGRLQAVLEFFSTAKRAPDAHLLHVIEGIGEQLGRVLERRFADEQRDLLARELSHRVGNTLSVVQSVFSRSASHAASVEDLSSAFQARLVSLAAAHRHLASGNWQSVDFAELVRSTLEPYCSAASRNCNTDGHPVILEAAAAMPISMVLHELATNAAKHGAFASPEGHLHLSWVEERTPGARMLRISWIEQGAPKRADNKRVGYGTTLIDMTIERGLGGTVRRTYGSTGLTVDILLPLESTAKHGT